jgi:DNA recombination protein RmuC
LKPRQNRLRAARFGGGNCVNALCATIKLGELQKMMIESLLIVIIFILLIAIVLCTLVLFRAHSSASAISPTLEQRLSIFDGVLAGLDTSVRAELAQGRNETGTNARSLREEIVQNLQALGVTLGHTLDQGSQAQRERLDRLSVAIAELTQRVEQRLDTIRAENTEKLENIRQAVDEKLQSTLNERLGTSFQVVSDWLEKVHISIGEMQSLASGVGDLKRLLTNVRARGTWGEVSLANILEEMMAPDQFGRNVEIVPGSNQRVEYAIRLPGDGEVPIWMPIDSKFPTEDYERLEDARQHGQVDAVEAASKAIENAIRVAAKDISTKYIHSPHSTDFAVLFLPTEGLFAEVLRRPGLVNVYVVRSFETGAVRI